MTLDIFGVDRFQTVNSYDQLPRAERRTCNLNAVISTHYGDTHGRIVNISAGGIGFVLDPVIRLKPGEKFITRHDKLGDLSCTIRWSSHPRYGAEFDAIGKKSRTVSDFYDSLGTQASLRT